MAVFNLGSGTDLNNLDDLQKVKSYLYKLTEQLKYMFNNLTPEDNYSTNAQLIYAADKERQATLEVSLDAIRATYITQEGVESAIKLSEDQAAMTYSTKDGTKAALELSEQQAALTYVAKTGVVSAINLSQEGAKIKADKITLEGVVTANQNFKILLDGSIEAKNAKFSGSITGSSISGSSLTLGGANNVNGTLTVKNSNNQTIGTWTKDGINISSGSITGGTINGANIVVGGSNNASGTITVKNASGQTVGTWNKDGLSVTNGTISGTTINGGTITGSHLYGSYIGSTSDDFYVVEDGDSVEVGVPGFWFGDKIMHSNWMGSITNEATGDDMAGINGGNGYAGFRKLYLLDDWYEGQDGTFWDVTRTLRWLDSRLAAIESAGCGSNTCNDYDSGDGGGTCIGEVPDYEGCNPRDYVFCDIDYDGESCGCDGGEQCGCDGGECSDYICSHTCEDGMCGPGDGM